MTDKSKKNEYMRTYNRTPRGNLYQRWRLIVRRCCDPSHKNYPRYGARGINICERWKDFEAFYQWSINNGYKLELQIDRIDNNKGYCPENCRWVTSANNNRNRRNNKLDIQKAREIRKLLKEGESGCSVAKRYGVDPALIYRIRDNKQWVE